MRLFSAKLIGGISNRMPETMILFCRLFKQVLSGLTGLRDFLPHNAHPPLKESLLNAIELLTFRAFQHRGSTAWTCFTRVTRMTASISSTQTEMAVFTHTAIRKLTEEVGRLSSED